MDGVLSIEPAQLVASRPVVTPFLLLNPLAYLILEKPFLILEPKGQEDKPGSITFYCCSLCEPRLNFRVDGGRHSVHSDRSADIPLQISVTWLVSITL